MPNIQKMKRAKFGFRILSLFRVYDQSVAFFFFLLLPTQLAKHFFFDFSYLSGIRVDYLAIKLYVIDLVVLCSIIWHLPFLIHKLKNTKVVIIGGILLLNLLLSQSKIITWYQSIRIFEMILVVILVLLWVINKRFGKTFLTASLMASMVQLGIAVIQLSKKGSIQGIFYFIGERFFTAATPGIARASIEGMEFVRPYATFSHPNSLGGFYLLLYVIVLTFPIFSRYHYLKTAVLGVSALLIFISFSKIAIFGFLFINLIFYIRENKTRNCILCLISKLFIFIVLGLIFFSVQSDPKSLEKRLALNKTAITVIRKYPISGTGLGAYLPVQNVFPQQFIDIINQPVHNIFLLLIAETGIPLFFFILFIFRSDLIKMVHNIPLPFLAFVITGSFDHYWLTLMQNILLAVTVLGIYRGSKAFLAS